VVVTFPVDAGAGVRTLASMSMWEQFSLAALLQRYWADNQVSCTITFDPATEGPQVPHALDYFQYQLKVRHAAMASRLVGSLGRASLWQKVLPLSPCLYASD
jgi:hypothetical protein